MDGAASLTGGTGATAPDVGAGSPAAAPSVAGNEVSRSCARLSSMPVNDCCAKPRISE